MIVSAPYDDADVTIVYGVNHDLYEHHHKVISASSCTTNCLATVANALDRLYGIKRGHATTIHSYTNDQVVLDSVHDDKCRGRAAAMSMIPTSTGAAKSLSTVLPHLRDLITASSVRVPVNNVSLVDFISRPKEK